MFDLNGLMNALITGSQGSNQRIDSIGQELAANTATMEDLMAQNLEASQAAVPQVANLATQKAELDYTRAKSIEQAQAQAGLVREDANNEFARSMAELTATRVARQKVKAKADKLSEVGLFDNPVLYILNQLELPKVATQYNNLVDRETEAVSNIANRTAMLQQYNQNTVAATADAARSLAMESAKFLQSEAEQKVREQQIQNLSRIGEQKIRQANLEDKKWDNLSRVYNTQMSMAQFTASQAERAEMRAIRIEEAQARLSDKKQQQEAKHELDGRIAAVSEFLGQVNPDGTPRITSVESLQNVIRDPAKRTAWGQVATSGMFGSNFGEALQFVAGNADINFLSQTRPNLAMAVREMGRGVQDQMTRLNRRDPTTGKIPDQKTIAKEAPNSYEQQIVASATLRKEGGTTLTSPVFDTTFNPYRAPHAIMLKSAEAGLGKGVLENNVFMEAVKTVAQTKGNGGNLKGVDEQEAFRIVGELVKSRQVTPQAASAQIAGYYKFAALYADDAYGTSTVFGLPKQTSYAAQVEVPAKGFGTDTLRVDFMNPASVEKALTLYSVGRLDYLQKFGAQNVFGIGTK